VPILHVQPAADRLTQDPRPEVQAILAPVLVEGDLAIAAELARELRRARDRAGC
jgi:hypothetical protein